jgi:hypothetical protein
MQVEQSLGIVQDSNLKENCPSGQTKSLQQKEKNK